jgi:Holliday junction resolvase-like predicted endonuclease
VHVDARKQRKLTALAMELVRRRRWADRAVRFDVVAVVWPQCAKQPTRITHHTGAFEAQW